MAISGSGLKKKHLILFHLHKFFTRFGLNIFFAFGVLVLYAITNSVYITLMFLLVQYLSIIILNTVFLNVTLNILNKFDIKRVMFFGLFIFGMTFIIIPQLNNNSQYFVLTLLIISTLAALGANLYYTPGEMARLNYIGSSKKPGLSASLFNSNATIAGLMASFITLYINKTASIILLFILAGASFVLSFSFLYFVQLEFKKFDTKFSKYIKKLHTKEHLACMELNHELYNVGIPFVILFTLGSINKSISIIAVSSVLTLIIINFAGIFKDKNNNAFLYIAAMVQIGAWASYVFVKSPIGFITLGILISSSYKVINSTYEAKLGQRLADGDAMDIKLSSNFSQILGRIIILIMLLLIYIIVGTIPKEILMLGSIFIIPRILFTLKKTAIK